jgi:hypothetical protein
MRLEAWCVLATAMMGSGCGKGGDLEGTYSASAFLTVSGVPVAGTTATSVGDVVCAGAIRIESHDGGEIRGTFDRLRCSGLLMPADDVHGDLSGAVLNGAATLAFGPAPLASSLAFTTSGGCIPAPEAAGPYVGRIDRTSLSLRSRFRVHCAGLAAPGTPAFDVEYRIEGKR